MKTTPELGITPAELEALLWVRSALASGEILTTEENEDGLLLPEGAGFNMSTSATVTRCGTVACLGGWMASYLSNPERMLRWCDFALSDQLAHEYVVSGRSPALHHLFHPLKDNDGNPIEGPNGPLDVEWRVIAASDAIKAIDNFTSTGDADWPHVLIPYYTLPDVLADVPTERW